MPEFSRCLKVASIAALIFSSISVLASGPSQAVTAIPFNNPSNDDLVATVTGTGGTLNFRLDIGSEDVFGEFAMDIFSNPGNPGGGTLLGRIDLLLGPAFTGMGPTLHGSIEYNPPFSLGVDGFLTQKNSWFLNVAPIDVALYIYVSSDLVSTTNQGFTPSLRVAFTEGLEVQVLAPVPLPAALPMFAAGLSVFGLMGWRRRRKVALASQATAA